MSNSTQSPADEQSRWLTPSQRTVCQQVATNNEPPHSQRAEALLVLDNGATYAQAAEQTGLSMGQLKYCVTAFRRKQLDIFPPEMMATTPSTAALDTPLDVEPEPEPEATPPAVPTETSEVTASPEKKKKKKKKKSKKEKAGKEKKKKKKKKKKEKKKKKKGKKKKKS